MQTWAIILSAILIAIIAILGGVNVWLYKQNESAKQSNILYPFSSAIPAGGTVAPLTNAAGGAQIDCSAVGGKINIVGAIVETIDPFGTCSGTSAPSLNLSCGIPSSSKISCNQDSDCGPGMNCAGGICAASSCPTTNSSGDFNPTNCSCGGTYCPTRPGRICKTNPDCGDPSGTLMTCDNGECAVNPGQTCMAPDQYTGKKCAIYPLCSNVTNDSTSIVNNVCGYNNNQNVCRPRDASAYLASVCDGQTTCPVTFDPTNQSSGFGPAPCGSSVSPSTGVEYNLLPIVPGQGGSYNQGFYVHGLYSCVL